MPSIDGQAHFIAFSPGEFAMLGASDSGMIRPFDMDGASLRLAAIFDISLRCRCRDKPQPRHFNAHASHEVDAAAAMPPFTSYDFLAGRH